MRDKTLADSLDSIIRHIEFGGKLDSMDANNLLKIATEQAALLRECYNLAGEGYYIRIQEKLEEAGYGEKP